jgi:hypothetical protein
MYVRASKTVRSDHRTESDNARAGSEHGEKHHHSLLAFIGERRRFPSTVLGVGSDPVIGLGNISFPLNPDWFLSYLLTATSAGDLQDGPLAFAIGTTELFAVTALCARALKPFARVAIMIDHVSQELMAGPCERGAGRVSRDGL